MRTPTAGGFLKSSPPPWAVTRTRFIGIVIVPPKAVDILRRDYRVVRELGPVVVNGKAGMQCQCYEGSSKYDTAEMARFIDGIVQECEELGIETESPDELARMKREWGA